MELLGTSLFPPSCLFVDGQPETGDRCTDCCDLAHCIGPRGFEGRKCYFSNAVEWPAFARNCDFDSTILDKIA